MKVNNFTTKVWEQHPEYEDKEVEIEVFHDAGGQLWIEVRDDDYTCSQGILVEFYEGELRAIVWADPEEEDPTHKIKIEPMSEEFSKEYNSVVVRSYSQEMQDDLEPIGD
tara:strand:+ start:98 stop:427 length:330 start_codon:yes stop_codon:yes gene_type:complete